MKNKLLKIFILSVTGMIFLYLSFLYILPAVLNSTFILNKAKEFLHKKTEMSLNTENLHFQTFRNLKVELTANKLALMGKNDETPVTIKNLIISYDIKKLKPAEIYIDYVYIDEEGLRDIISKHAKKKTSELKLSYVPKVKINKTEIWADRQDISTIYILLTDINIEKHKDKKTYCYFNAEIVSNLLENIIETGQKGYIYTDDDGIYAKDLEVSFGMPKLMIDGKLYDNDKNNCFKISGKSLPVSDIEQSLLYFLKLRKKGKQFIENFYDFGGEIDIDLEVKNNEIYGRCTANNLSANSVLFNVPILFKQVFFNFNGREVNSKAVGTLGGEKVFNVFNLTGMATDNQEVKGHVNAVITDKLADKYIPELTVVGIADASVDYKVKNKIMNVDYLLKLPKSSDLIFKNAYLGRTDTERQVLINTVKRDDKLDIEHYEYSDVIQGQIKKILTGKGLFVRKNGILDLKSITMKTNGYVPATITGSFGKSIEGGMFSGNLKYDFDDMILTGDFIVKDTKYKKFYVDEAKVSADRNITNISAEGTFENKPFSSYLKAKSEFADEIYVYDMLLHLDEYVIEPSKENKPKPKINKQTVEKIKKEARELDITIEKWTVQIDKIKRQRIKFENVVLTGSLKNEVFKFLMPEIKFADGVLKARGYYNFNNKSSEVDFEAGKINSDKVAAVIFNLPGQIEGIADAKIKALTNNGYKDFKAYIDFKINDGMFTKIGSTEFIIKKSKKVKRDIKFKFEDLINTDIKYMDALRSDLTGSFIFENNKIKNAKITSSQMYFSFLLEGEYDIDNQYADMQLFGIYDGNVQKRVKIFFIPLSWITKLLFKKEYTYDKYKNKLDLIPSYKTGKDDVKAFRVKLNGDLNNNDVKIEMKSII